MPLKRFSQSAEIPSCIFRLKKKSVFGSQCSTRDWRDAGRVRKYGFLRIYTGHGRSCCICSQGTSKGSNCETCPSNPGETRTTDFIWPQLSSAHPWLRGERRTRDAWLQRPAHPPLHRSGQVDQTITAWSQRTVSRSRPDPSLSGKPQNRTLFVLKNNACYLYIFN